jgi:hypothetical protein
MSQRIIGNASGVTFCGRGKNVAAGDEGIKYSAA